MASARSEPKLRLAALKLSHHGSKGNTTPGLMRTIDCQNYLVSTDGSIFHHPDAEAIECVLANSKSARLFFNYQSQYTTGWKSAPPGAPGFAAYYPARNGESITIDLLAATGSP
jgi:hypothetical protein